MRIGRVFLGGIKLKNCAARGNKLKTVRVATVAIVATVARITQHKVF